MPRFQQNSGPDPVFISYYTEDSIYEKGAMRLIESMRKFDLVFDVMPVRDQGNWQENCRYKAQFVHDLWNEYGRPVCWVDADAVFESKPDVLFDYSKFRTVDFAVWPSGNESDPSFNGGTLFFNRTEPACRLLTLWLRESKKLRKYWTEQEILTPDQIFLKTAWNRLKQEGNHIVTAWLPQAYCKIFDTEQEHKSIPDTIVHYQFSRQICK